MIERFFKAFFGEIGPTGKAWILGSAVLGVGFAIKFGIFAFVISFGAGILTYAIGLLMEKI